MQRLGIEARALLRMACSDRRFLREHLSDNRSHTLWRSTVKERHLQWGSPVVARHSGCVCLSILLSPLIAIARSPIGVVRLDCTKVEYSRRESTLLSSERAKYPSLAFSVIVFDLTRHWVWVPFANTLFNLSLIYHFSAFKLKILS